MKTLTIFLGLLLGAVGLKAGSTDTFTPTWTPTITQTHTFSPTLTITPTWTPTATRTWTRTATPTFTSVRSGTFTRTHTKTITSTSTRSPTMTRTQTHTPTVTKTVSRTLTPTRTQTPNASVTATWTPGLETSFNIDVPRVKKYNYDDTLALGTYQIDPATGAPVPLSAAAAAAGGATLAAQQTQIVVLQAQLTQQAQAFAYDNTTNARFTTQPRPAVFSASTSFVPAVFASISASNIAWAGHVSYSASMAYLSTTACLYSRTFYSNITISAVHFVLMNSQSIPTDVSVAARVWTIAAQSNTNTTGIITSSGFEMAGSYVVAWLDVASAASTDGTLGRFGEKETNCGYLNQVVYSDATWFMMKVKRWAKDLFASTAEKFIGLADVVMMTKDAHATINFSPNPPGPVLLTSNAFSGFNSLSSQAVLTFTASVTTRLGNINVNLANLAKALTVCTLSVNITRVGGTSIKAGLLQGLTLAGALAGDLAWTITTDAKEVNVDLHHIVLAPGDKVVVNSIMTIAEDSARAATFYLYSWM